jgi:hypothetical protein
MLRSAASARLRNAKRPRPIATNPKRTLISGDVPALELRTIVSTPPPVAIRMRLIATYPKRERTKRHWTGSKLAGLASRAQLIIGGLKRRRTSGPQTEIEPSRTATTRLLTESRPHLIAVSPRRKPISAPRVAANPPETANAWSRTARRPSQTELRLTAILTIRERN